MAGAQATGRGGDQALARARPRDLGGARRAAALHLEQDHVLGGAGPWGQAGRAAWLDETHQGVARHRRGDQGRHPGQRRGLPRGAHPALRQRRAGRLAVAGGADPVPAARRPADPRDGAGHRRRAHRGGAGAAVSRRGDRRRAVRRGGHVHDLLVLAGVGAGRDRRDPPGQAPVRAAAVVRQPAASVRRGDRAAHRAAPGQLPAGVHPPGADQRRGARHPRRRGRRRVRGVPARECADLSCGRQHLKASFTHV